MKTIGILGCSGFIGAHLLEKILCLQKYRVVGIDKVFDRIEHLLPHRLFRFVKTDIYKTPLLDQCIEECDIIVSLAALCNPSLYNTEALEVIESNFLRPYELVKLCAEKKKKLIHFSTSEVYGKTVQGIAGDALLNSNHESHYLLSENDTPLILGPVYSQRWSYAAAKQLLERAIYACGIEKGLDYTIIRPFNFIGPRMDYIPGIDGEGIPRVLACFMEAILLGKPLKLVDGGHNRRVFTYIDDAVDAVIRIVEQPKQSSRRIFNIGNPRNETTIRALAQMMIDLYTALYPHHQINPEIINVSSSEFYGDGYDDCDRRVPDITSARKLLGWEPQTGLRDTLTKTIISYVKYYGKEHVA